MKSTKNYLLLQSLILTVIGKKLTLKEFSVELAKQMIGTHTTAASILEGQLHMSLE